jgi:5-deoxy-glucuronate isomerase
MKDFIYLSSLGWRNANPIAARDARGSTMSRRFFPASDFAFSNGMKSITPQIAGWKYSGLTIIQLEADIPYLVDPSILDGAEGALIPLNATDLAINIDGQNFTLKGRCGVFDAATDWIYCAKGSRLEISSSSGGEIAIATAIAHTRFPSCYVDALTSIEIRGSGDATREVRPFMHPDHFKNADRLMAVELITPDGNVSSYPPHRHDGMGDCHIANEEIYYFRIGKIGQPHGDSEGFGFHRTYAGDEYEDPFDDNVAIHDGDIYLVPRGYHGPCSAMPGYPMYYLNVLAGENSPRSMDFCDDPNHAWIRDSWNDTSPDPRVPWKVN